MTKKSVTTLIKLADRRVVNQHGRVSLIEKTIQDIENHIGVLNANLENEARAAMLDPFAGLHFGAYSRGIQKKIQNLNEQRAQQETVLTRERDRLSQLYKEMKVLEVYEQNQKHQEQVEQRHAEQKETDEIAGRLKSVQSS